MKTKFTLFTLAAASLLTAASQLQAADPTPAPPAAPAAPAAPGEGGGRRQGGQGGMRGGDPTAMLKQQLGLSDEQVEKLKPIFAKQTEKMTALRGDQALTQEQRREKMTEIRKATQEEVKPILTAEQAEKYKALNERAPGAGGAGGGRRNGGAGGAGGAPVATPPAAK